MGLVVRDASAADYPVVARLFPELGVEDPVPTLEQFASRMLPRAIIAEEEGGAPLGYAFWRVYGKTTHVGHVVTSPIARGRGVGRALLEAIRTRVLGDGCTRWYLNVKQDNAVAIRLYERTGFATEDEAWALKTAWSRLALLPVTEPDIDVFVPTPEEDVAVAAKAGLDPERIAFLRAGAGVAIVSARERGAHVGFAAFDPFHPGIYPIRVARPTLAPLLLEALRVHAREDRVMVTVEGDRGLRDVLVENGARLAHAVYRMSAALTSPGAP